MTHDLIERRVAPACSRHPSVRRVRGTGPAALALAFAATSAAIGVTGCSDSDSDRGVAAPAGESIAAGVPTIRNGVHDPGSPAFTVFRDLRVGAQDGESTFGRISDVAPRRDGGMWVVDAQSRQVSGFDRTGTLVVRFGGEGDGPGEFRNVSGVFETTAGRVAIGSPFPPTLHWFGADGSYLESIRFTDSFDSDGNPLAPRFAVWSVTRSGRPFADLFAVSRAGSDPMVPHDVIGFDGQEPAFARRDTIISWSVAAPPTDPGAPLPIVPAAPKWTTGPGDRVWWTPGSPYEITAFDPTGEPVRAITLDRPAVPVTTEVRESIAEAMRRAAGSAPGGISLVEHALSRAEWPQALPHLAGIWVSNPDGMVFAAPFSALSFDPEAGMTLDVFEADGSYAGTILLPPGFSPRRFANGAVYGVETDELDVNYAVRYRIEREP